MSAEAIEYLNAFSSGNEKHRFIYMISSDYKARKELLSAVKTGLMTKGKDYTYIQMEGYTHNLIKAVQQGKNGEFNESYENVPALILEDIELVAGKTATQEHVYLMLKNRYYNDLPTLIIAPYKLPDDKFDRRLISLLNEWEVITV